MIVRSATRRIDDATPARIGYGRLVELVLVFSSNIAPHHPPAVVANRTTPCVILLPTASPHETGYQVGVVVKNVFTVFLL